MLQGDSAVREVNWLYEGKLDDCSKKARKYVSSLAITTILPMLQLANVLELVKEGSPIARKPAPPPPRAPRRAPPPPRRAPLQRPQPADGARIPPAVNQVELHPYLQQDDLLAFAREADVALTAYSPLGSMDRADSMKAEDEPVLLEDETVGAVASKHGVTPAQVLIAWALARGTAVIPKSVNPGRIRQNLAATEIALDEEDLARIAELDRHRRYVDGSFWAKEGGPYSLSSLWDE